MRALHQVERIIVHHAAIPAGEATLERIRREHVEGRGWRDIGYHFVVELGPGGVWRVRAGRPTWAEGAHCRASGMNRRSLGVCLAGYWSPGHDGAPPPEAWRLLVSLLAALCHDRGLVAANILGHREVPGAKTECPGRSFGLDALRRDVGKLLRNGRN